MSAPPRTQIGRAAPVHPLQCFAGGVPCVMPLPAAPRPATFLTSYKPPRYGRPGVSAPVPAGGCVIDQGGFVSGEGSRTAPGCTPSGQLALPCSRRPTLTWPCVACFCCRCASRSQRWRGGRRAVASPAIGMGASRGQWRWREYSLREQFLMTGCEGRGGGGRIGSTLVTRGRTAVWEGSAQLRRCRMLFDLHAPWRGTRGAYPCW